MVPFKDEILYGCCRPFINFLRPRQIDIFSLNYKKRMILVGENRSRAVFEKVHFNFTKNASNLTDSSTTIISIHFSVVFEFYAIDLKNYIAFQVAR